MRIDLNRLGAGQVANEQSAAAKKVTSSKPEHVSAAEDKATLSSDSVAINSLAAKAMEQPEVRNDRVAELREQIQTGQYKVDSGKVVDAIFREHSK